MTPTTSSLIRLGLFAWLTTLSLLLLPLLYTGPQRERLMSHWSLLEMIQMKPTSTAVAYNWLASFVMTRIALYFVFLAAAVFVEIRHRRHRIDDSTLISCYAVATGAMLTSLTVGLLGILTMIIAI